jgi:hypothetical protein
MKNILITIPHSKCLKIKRDCDKVAKMIGELLKQSLIEKKMRVGIFESDKMRYIIDMNRSNSRNENFRLQITNYIKKNKIDLCIDVHSFPSNDSSNGDIPMYILSNVIPYPKFIIDLVSEINNNKIILSDQWKGKKVKIYTGVSKFNDPNRIDGTNDILDEMIENKIPSLLIEFNESFVPDDPKLIELIKVITNFIYNLDNDRKSLKTAIGTGTIKRSNEYCLLCSFIQWIEKSYEKNNFIPYEISTLKNDSIIIKKDENFINCETIFITLKILDSFGISLNLKKRLIENLNYYIDKFTSNPKEMGEASSVLGLSLLLDEEKYKLVLFDIYNYLFDQTQPSEKSLIFLTKKKLDRKMIDQELILCNELKKLKNPYELNNIFKYNWNLKFVYELRRQIKKREFNSIHLLLKNVIGITENQLTHLDSMETNHLAILFECICILYSLIKEKKLVDYKNLLFIQWIKRKSEISRINIICHVLNGLLIE